MHHELELHFGPCRTQLEDALAAIQTNLNEVTRAMACRVSEHWRLKIDDFLLHSKNKYSGTMSDLECRQLLAQLNESLIAQARADIQRQMVDLRLPYQDVFIATRTAVVFGFGR